MPNYQVELYNVSSLKILSNYRYVNKNYSQYETWFHAKLGRAVNTSTLNLRTMLPLRNGTITVYLNNKINVANYICIYSNDTFNKPKYYYYKIRNIMPALSIAPPRSSQIAYEIEIELDVWHTYYADMQLDIRRITRTNKVLGNFPYYGEEEKRANWIGAGGVYAAQRRMGSTVCVKGSDTPNYYVVAEIIYISSTKSTVFETKASDSIMYIAFKPENNLKLLLDKIGNINEVNNGAVGVNVWNDCSLQRVWVIPADIVNSPYTSSIKYFKSFQSGQEITLTGYIINSTLNTEKVYNIGMGTSLFPEANGFVSAFNSMYLILGLRRIKLPKYYYIFNVIIKGKITEGGFQAILNVGNDIYEDISDCFECRIVTNNNINSQESVAQGLNKINQALVGGITLGAAVGSGNVGGIISGGLNLASTFIPETARPGQTIGQANGNALYFNNGDKFQWLLFESDTNTPLNNTPSPTMNWTENNTYDQKITEIFYTGAVTNIFIGKYTSGRPKPWKGIEPNLAKALLSASYLFFKDKYGLKEVYIEAEAEEYALPLDYSEAILQDLSNGVMLYIE